MAMRPDGPASEAQRRLLGHLGAHDLANSERLTASAASKEIDRLRGKSESPPPPPRPAAPPPRPAPAEKAVTTVEPVAKPAAAEETDDLWIQVSAWVPVDRVGIVTRAFAEARRGAG